MVLQQHLWNKNAAEIQRELLQKILERNVGTEYLQRRGLHHHPTKNLVDEFKKLPLVEYGDIEAEIQRIADGDSSQILCSDRVSKFFISSGTTSGKSKLIPMTEETVNQTHNNVFRMKRNETYLVLWFASEQFYTKGGLTAETVTTSGLNSETFKQTASSFVTPYQVYQSTNIYQCMYCHLLCGLLRAEEITIIVSAFAFTMTQAFKMLQELHPELLDDLTNGSLSSRITDKQLRSAMVKMLRPDALLAGKLRREFDHFDGIAERLWPRAKCITAVTTGAMLPYVPRLRAYAGNVPLVSGNYLSSECLIGINLCSSSAPEDVGFTVNPEFAYFEFLPADDDQITTPEAVVGLADVQVGQKYEIVVTTLAGLYRYRLGDVVKVTGFCNSSPTLSFLFRKNVVLSIATDKTDESELQAVVLKASKLLLRENSESVQLVDFTSYADFSSLPAHYTVFWELKNGGSIDPETLRQCCELLDVSFNNPYMRGRRSRSIGPLELCLVKEGSFDRLFQNHLQNGGSGSQYKAPRCVVSVESLQLLKRNTFRSVFSRSSEFPDSAVSATESNEFQSF